jgi:predicted nucleic acid-binding protein
LDAQCLIYTVEQFPVWFPLLDPLWQTVQGGTLRVASSELSLLECLVLPYRRADQKLIGDFEGVLSGPGVDLIPITPDLLRHAARLRAAVPKLRTPDAIHAATALEVGVALFVTNDTDFRNVPGLPVAVLRDLIP